MIGISFVNDFSEPRRNAKRIITEHLAGRGEFSFSYIAQIISATIVCTLGLILNSTAVIIGGMIIAPLMWPILNVSYSLATKRNLKAFNPLLILVVSVMIIFAGSTFVALLTPYKEITSEILLRTAPTSLEIFIALAAAVIAALAVTLPKISDSVAGVAVATSLVPPLCVSGIGLAYFNLDVLYGGMLLFLTNAITIMLVATIIFSVFVYGKDFSNLKKKQVATLGIVLLIISVPLYSRLQSSLSSSAISSSAKATIELRLEEYVPNAELQNYQVLISSGDKVSIRAVVLLPPSRNITFEQEQELVADLTQQLNKQVDLQLFQQDSIKPVSEKEITELDELKLVEETVSTRLQQLESTIQINSLNSQLSETVGWNIAVSIRSSFDLTFGTEEITEIEEAVTELTGNNASITVEVIKSTYIGGEQSEVDSLVDSINSTIREQPGIRSIISMDTGTPNNDDSIDATAVLLVDGSFEFNEQILTELEARVSAETGRQIRLSVSLVESISF